MEWAQKNRILITALLVLLLVPYVYIGFYSHPSADDFSYAYKSTLQSFWANMLGEYNTWNGRYFSNIFLLNNPIHFNRFDWYSYSSLLLLLGTVVGWMFLLRKAGCSERKYTLPASFILLLLYLHQMPVLSEGIYWYTGAMTYQLSCILLLFFAGQFLVLLKEELSFTRRIFTQTSLLFLTICIIGCNETSLSAMVLFSFFLVLKRKHFSSVNRRFVVLLLLVTLGCSLFVYFAPGNRIRSAYFTDTHQVLFSLQYTFIQTARFLFYWVSSIPLLAASLLFLLYFDTILRLFPKTQLLFSLTYWELIGLLLGVLFVGLFPAYWSTGMLGQLRTPNVSYFLFLPLWLGLLGHWRMKDCRFLFVPKKWQIITIFSLMLGGLGFSENGWTIVSDSFSGRITSFDRQMKNRYDLLKKSTDVVYLPTIHNPPKSLFVLGITHDPTNWLNEVYAKYFGKPGLKIYQKVEKAPNLANKNYL